jgi:hypothetical protein
MSVFCNFAIFFQLSILRPKNGTTLIKSIPIFRIFHEDFKSASISHVGRKLTEVIPSLKTHWPGDVILAVSPLVEPTIDQGVVD